MSSPSGPPVNPLPQKPLEPCAAPKEQPEEQEPETDEEDE